jgi:hypothetical protein
MKIVEKQFNDKVMGAEKEMSFSISDDNPIIFEILRNKMYSNKIGSICREVSSNSRDANRESGNSDLPITIEIIQPDELLYVGDLSISFGDNGIGITPDRMENVFVKYAASTKRDTNGQTGGFGLGAKTPFAYTDTFTIATVCDWEGKRQQFIYTAMIDSTRKGKMILFETTEVDKPCGTQIIIPIANSTDRREFEKESMYYTSMWKEGVNYNGFEKDQEQMEVLFEQETFDIVKRDHKQYQLLIDGVPYPLEKDQVGVTDDGLGSDYGIVLKFPTGKLSISANREAVQYDESTIGKIRTALKNVKKFLTERAVEELKFESYLEGCLKLREMINKESWKITDDRLKLYNYAIRSDYNHEGILGEDRKEFISSFTFNNQPLISSLYLKHHTITYVEKPRDNGGKTNYEGTSKTPITQKFIDAPKYYLDTKKNLRRNATIWEESPVFMLIMPHGSDQAGQISEMEKMAWTMDMDIKMYKDVAMMKMDATSNYKKYKKSVKVSLRTKLVKNRREYRSGNGYQQVVVSQTFEIDRNTFEMYNGNGKKLRIRDYVYFIVDSLREIYLPANISDKMIALIEHGNKKVIIINQKSYDRYVSKMGMMEYQSTFDKMFKRCEAQWKINVLRNKIIEAAQKAATRALTQIKPELFPQSVRQAIASPDIELSSQVRSLIKTPPYNVEGLKAKIELVIKQRYPMLIAYCSDQYSDNSNRNTYDNEAKKKVIEDYIKLVG